MHEATRWTKTFRIDLESGPIRIFLVSDVRRDLRHDYASTKGNEGINRPHETAWMLIKLMMRSNSSKNEENSFLCRTNK